MSPIALTLAKLVMLFAAAVLALQTRSHLLLGAGILLLVVGASLRRELVELVKSMRAALLFILAIAASHALVASIEDALLVGSRLLFLVLIGAAFTATTRFTDLLAALEMLLLPLRWVGVDPARPALMLTLTVRCITLLGETVRALRDAQRARGVERLGPSLVVPLLIHTLRRADALADALDARGVVDSGPARRATERHSSGRLAR